MRLELVTAALLSETRSIEPGKPFMVAIQLKMLSGWHVNWINPGDAGLAPSVTWTLPDGFEAGEILWPYPARFDMPELAIFGYEGSVLLLCQITPPQHMGVGRQTLRAQVDWLACKGACVPGKSDVALTLTVDRESGDAHDDWAREIDEAKAKLPVRTDRWRFRAVIDDDRLEISAIAPKGEPVEVEGVSFFPFADGVIENAAAQEFERKPDGFRLELTRARMSTEKPTRIRGVLVSRNGWGAITSKALEVDIPVDG
jgi:DsbC/DsbD-like thiol-disulfide interchange protein